MFTPPGNRTVVVVFLLVLVGAYIWRGQWRRLVAWLGILIVACGAWLLLRTVVATRVVDLVAFVLIMLPLFDGVWLLLSGRPLLFPSLLRPEKPAGDEDAAGSRTRK